MEQQKDNNRRVACYANGSVISITYMSRNAIEVEQISKHTCSKTFQKSFQCEPLINFFLLQPLE